MFVFFLNLESIIIFFNYCVALDEATLALTAALSSSSPFIWLSIEFRSELIEVEAVTEAVLASELVGFWEIDEGVDDFDANHQMTQMIIMRTIIVMIVFPVFDIFLFKLLC